MKRALQPDRRRAGAWRTVIVASVVGLAAAALARWSLGTGIAIAAGAVAGVLYWIEHHVAVRRQRAILDAVDAMQTAAVLWDRHDRLVFANADFKRLYGLDDAGSAPGTTFEQLLRNRVAAGAIPEAAGREEAWIAERLGQHRMPGGATLLRQMPDGRWRRIVEQPLSDGRVLSYSIDVTELIERERELAASRAETERAHQLLRDAIEAMPAGIEIYDADDRLVIHNRRLAQLYPHVAEQMAQGQRFEDMVRQSLQRGSIPAARGREEAWLAERLARRGGAADPLVQQLGDGTWLQIHETRSADGAIVGVRLDVTELVRQREAAASAHVRAEQAQRLLLDAVEAMPAAVEIYDAEDRLALFNQRMLRLYPYFDRASMTGQRFETLVQRGLERGLIPEARGQETDWLAHRLAEHAAGHEAPRLQQAPDGSWIHIYETRIGSGGIVVVRLDVSEVILQRDAQREARELLDDAIESLPDGFALFDAEDRLVLCNRRYRDIYQASAPALVPGASFESILRYGLERGQYADAQGGPDAWLAERLRRHRETDGAPILQLLDSGRWLRIDERRTRRGGIAGVRTDVTELMHARQNAEAARGEAQQAAAALREANAALETLSTTDAVTGLANRRRFDLALRDELQRVHRLGAPLSLMLIDIDYFKRYNDRHGHPQGDRALESVAQVLANEARRAGELAARYGGEEFAILLPHADADAAHAVAERCHAALARLALPHGGSSAASHLTLSIGIAQWRGEDAAALVRRADEALYAAKGAGRACSVVAAEPSQTAGRTPP